MTCTRSTTTLTRRPRRSASAWMPSIWWALQSTSATQGRAWAGSRRSASSNTAAMTWAVVRVRLAVSHLPRARGPGCELWALGRGVPYRFRTPDPLGSEPEWRIEANAGATQEVHPWFRDEAVKMVIETSRPITEIARDIHVNEGTLGNWVNKYRAEHVDDEPALSVSERARLRELEREVRELRMKTEFLGKAAAFFAQEYR